MRLFLLLFIGLLIYQSVRGQQVRFTARADQAEMSLDQYLEVEFVLENAQAKTFLPPNFQGWAVINGPSTSSQVSIINGARSSKLSYIYTLSPKTVGTLSIGSANVEVAGKTYTSAPISIKVTKAGRQNIAGDPKALSKLDLFVSVKASPDQAFVGQQIHIEYKLFTTLDIENYNISYTPEFKGFHSSTIPKFNFPTNRETINGRTYVTKVIQAFSIYPIQSGTFNIDPMHTQVSVVVDEGGNANSFFLLPNTKGVNIISNPLTIEVKTLPQPQPPHFSGAVGRFKMVSEIDQLALKTNEAASITLYLEGDGDLNRVGKPYLQLDSSVFQVYEPKITKENTDYQATGFIGMREFNYPLVALVPGSHKIIPAFNYFDIDSNTYVTLASEVYHVNVSGKAAVLSKEDKLNLNASEILPLIVNPRLGSIHPFIGSTWYYLLLLFPGIIIIGQYIYQKQMQRKDLLGKSERIKKQERSKTIHALEGMAIKNNETKPAHHIDEINTMLSSFLRTYWELGDHPFTLKEWQNIIDQRPESAELKAAIKNLYKEFELSIYAGQPTGMKWNELVHAAKEVVEKL